ncbi:hypothetical protein CSKR_108505 [Clonorchis sinensis]|uniref:Uncharacterized protein n=1 Tax=Clonorchis sinensis TaxID=79923 RepID=A0A419QHR2_CLOSI|nr:hypothetical protein CSKR_108505 [Clonorchis sinensis]
MPTIQFSIRREAKMAQWLERKFTDQKVRGSKPISASRPSLSRLGQHGSIPALGRGCQTYTYIFVHSAHLSTDLIPSCLHRRQKPEYNTICRSAQIIYDYRTVRSCPAFGTLPTDKSDSDASYSAAISSVWVT